MGIIFELGISSCLLPCSELMEKADMLISVDSMLEENEFVVVMCFHLDPSPKREVIIYSKNRERLEGLSLHMREGKGSEVFQFSEIESSNRKSDNGGITKWLLIKLSLF